MKKLLLLVLPVFLLATMQKVSVQFEWKHQFEFAGFYAAKEQGYYRDIGLDVELKELQHNINVTDEVVNGNATFGFSSSSLIVDKFHNKPVVLLASFFKQNVLALVTQKDIKTISDLKNKKIMATEYEINKTSLAAMLKENKISRYDYTLVKHDFSIDKFQNGEIDAMSVFTTNQLYLLDKNKIPYNLINPSDFGVYSYDGELFTSRKFAQHNHTLVKNFVEATKKGWEYAFEHEKETVDLIYSKYSSKKSKEALLYEAKKTKEVFKIDTFTIGSIIPEFLELNAVIYQKIGLIAKSVNPKKVIEEYVFKYNADATISNEPLVGNSAKTQISLTNKEKEYLKSTTIKMCVDPEWMPFEKLENTKHIGMSADFFKIIEKNIGIKIEVVQTNSWQESVEFAKDRKCDIFSLAMETKERKKYMDFTTPYLTIPLVLATKTGVAFVADFNALENKKIAIPASYAFKEILKERYPKLDIIEVPNIKDGLSKVNRGEIFAYVGTLASVAYMFQTNFTGELQISGKFDEKWKLGIATRNDNPILLSIFQKAINDISETQKKAIVNKWIAIKYEKGIDYTLTYQIVFIALLLLFVSLYWTRKLSVINNELQITKTKAEEATRVKANFLANMSHEIRTPMNSIVSMSYLMKETLLNDIQTSYIQKIEMASNNLLVLINNILDLSKIEANKFTLEKMDFNLLEVLSNIDNLLRLKAAQKDLKFSIVYDKDSSMHLYGDGLRLSQILMNLMSNAIKFTDQGEVELSVEKKEKNLFRFCVTDTGIGLSSEQIKEIFTSFTQADSSITRKYGGTGLGLSISKELVELMDGKIWVESNINEGSKFIFEVTLEMSENKMELMKENISKEPEDTNKPLMDKVLVRELFERLKEATTKRRPQLCEPILEEFKKYKLDEQSQNKFDNVYNLIKRYKFEEARRVLDEK